MLDSLLDVTLSALNSEKRHLVFWLLQENAERDPWFPLSWSTKLSFRRLGASVWKLSKSVVETADEFELRGHIESSRLIDFQYGFDSPANNFRRPNITFAS